MVFLASCAKDPVPSIMKNKTYFSVLGDSFSAFEGYVDPDSNAVWHDFPEIGVTEPEQMWWYQLADKGSWKLEKNNSFSGSMICNLDHLGYYGAHSFIRRMDNLGNPDAIFVFGGTNDVFNGAPLGDYIYADWSEEQLCMFRPALAYLLSQLKQLYPKAKLYLLVDMDLCSGGVADSIRDAYIESMHVVANHYHVKSIDLYYIEKERWHPNVKGQQRIANQIIESFFSSDDY